MAKILLVEDDKSLREIYGVRLLAEGYDIVSAGDGEEALAMAIKEKPELIISDVMMPKISGFDMLDILRSTTETRDIKVIMMTALSSDDQRSRGEQLGADRYLVKSQVGIEDVVRTVHEVIGYSTTSAPAPVAEPAAGVPTPAPAVAPIETSTPTVLSGSAPGNDSAGPLPPQPTEVKPLESTLPQPTAPFSSPRPTNLGEEVLHSTDTSDALAGPDTPPIAPTEPVAAVAPVEPAAVEPLTTPETPASDDSAVGGLNFDAISPSAPVVNTELEVGESADASGDKPAESTTPPAVV